LASALIDGARQSGFGAALRFLDCRVSGWAAASSLAVERLAAAVAFNIHFQDCGVMDEAVDGRERRGLIGEDLTPFAEGLVGGARS